MALSRAQQIEAILAPYLGQSVTQATIRLQCKALNTTPEQLTQDQLPSLIDRLAIGLRVFVGADKANQIRAALGGIQ